MSVVFDGLYLSEFGVSTTSYFHISLASAFRLANKDISQGPLMDQCRRWFHSTALTSQWLWNMKVLYLRQKSHTLESWADTITNVRTELRTVATYVSCCSDFLASALSNAISILVQSMPPQTCTPRFAYVMLAWECISRTRWSRIAEETPSVR